jgi:pyruvate/2-oxoglutarate dehydrogenase complex dihydrolipoamide dehydrogenase (E3) component
MVAVNGVNRAKKITLATGSLTRKLTIPGVEMVKYYDNQNIFQIKVSKDSYLLAEAQ